MKVFKIIATLLLMPALAFAGGDEDWSVAKISPALIKNANVVIRNEEKIIKLVSLEKMTIMHHFVITILNENGDDFANVGRSYDKFNEIKSFEGTLYDFTGKKIKSLKNRDIEDRSLSSENLADDSRYKGHNFYYKVYPYTIEYTIEETKRETMFFPIWDPIWNENISVEKSFISLEVPSNYELRYRIYNYKGEPIILNNEKSKIYSWSLINQTAILAEPFLPSWKEIAPYIYFAPSEFQIEDYIGKMSSWEELGKFQLSLNKGLDNIPDDVKTKVDVLLQSVTTDKEKIRLLYEFLQANTRYISIQLGVGGWRPLDATFVGTKRYGDCKALSNYMYALLKYAGIKAYYTLVKAGDNENDIIYDFPARQFNHVILCVPNKGDTVWLECTSPYNPAGYMGGFTANRHALLITEEGGKLVTTPSYKLNDNLQIRNIKATLADDASLQIKSVTDYKGLEQDDLFGMIHYLQKDKQKEYLAKRFDLSTYDVDAFDYKELNASMPVLTETLDIYASNYASITGKRLFIIPNVLSRSPAKLKVDDTRKYNVVLKAEYRDLDTVEITIPAGYEAESVPQPVKIETKFGKYTNNATLKGNKIIYYRMMERYSGEFPPAAYADLVSFYDAIYKADRAKLVLVKKEEEKKAF